MKMTWKKLILTIIVRCVMWAKLIVLIPAFAMSGIGAVGGFILDFCYNKRPLFRKQPCQPQGVRVYVKEPKFYIHHERVHYIADCYRRLDKAVSVCGKKCPLHAWEPKGPKIGTLIEAEWLCFKTGFDKILDSE